MASASDDGHVRLWDVETGKVQAVLANMKSYGLDYVYGVAMSETGLEDHAILAAHTNNSITLWDVVTGRLLKALFTTSEASELSETSDRDESHESSEDGKDGVAQEQAKESQEPAILGDPYAPYQTTIEGSSVYDIAIASTDDRLAAVVDGKARLWSLENGLREIDSLGLGRNNKPGESEVKSIRFSPDSDYMIRPCHPKGGCKPLAECIWMYRGMRHMLDVINNIHTKMDEDCHQNCDANMAKRKCHTDQRRSDVYSLEKGLWCVERASQGKRMGPSHWYRTLARHDCNQKIRNHLVLATRLASMSRLSKRRGERSRAGKVMGWHQNSEMWYLQRLLIGSTRKKKRKAIQNRQSKQKFG